MKQLLVTTPPSSRPSSRRNPLRDLLAERARARKLAADLPALIETQVGEQIQQLEDRLIQDFRTLSERALEESAVVLNAQLDGRIESLERVSAAQAGTLLNLRDFSRRAEQRVGLVAAQIEQSLAAAVPGFRLPAPGVHPQFQLVRADTREVARADGRSGYCPSCTSPNVRRANRTGLFEEFLRLFFIAPFRCRACRHKFYRF